jgi:hypothetical protein
MKAIVHKIQNLADRRDSSIKPADETRPVAFKRSQGSCGVEAPEAAVVEDGTSGFVVDGEVEAAAALSRIEDLDRRHVRQAFECRFATRRMTEDYLRIYRKLAGAGVT